MKILIDNWYIIVALVACITCVVTVLIKFFNLPQIEQLEKVREWLLYAVVEAEKTFGTGTGKLKLRFVYDWFLSTFPWLAKTMTFEQFSMLVDDALEEMKNLLETNKTVSSYVGNGDDNDIQKKTD